MEICLAIYYDGIALRNNKNNLGNFLVYFDMFWKYPWISYLLTYEVSEMGSVSCANSVTKLVFSKTDLREVALFCIHVAQYGTWLIKFDGKLMTHKG